jgi:hypothetical protein
MNAFNMKIKQHCQLWHFSFLLQNDLCRILKTNRQINFNFFTLFNNMQNAHTIALLIFLLPQELLTTILPAILEPGILIILLL